MSKPEAKSKAEAKPAVPPSPRKRVEDLEAKLAQLKTRAHILAGKSQNRGAGQVEPLKKEIAELETRFGGLVRELESRGRSYLVPRRAEDWGMRYEALKQAVESFVTSQKLDAAVLKDL